jgi:dihydroorotate dehydrogenase
MYPFFRSLLFRLPPEKAHSLSLQSIRLVGALPPVAALLRNIFAVPSKQVDAFGLEFDNPVGLAAGYDKDGLGWRGLAALGFGHVEVGTVTLRPQPGNPVPRLFRIPEERALINRMGFPGLGAEFVAARLKGRKPSGLVLGVNLGKNKDTPLEEAVDDYRSLCQIFAPLADYLAINVSSPNTEGLRRLQARQTLDELLAVVSEERRRQERTVQRSIPLLVKLAPDLTLEELEDALDVILSRGMDGVIATNTTIQREGLRSPLASEKGGLSGEPLFSRSLEMVRQISRRTQGRMPVVGVGGIMNAAGAQKMLDAGAVLVQIYTGLVYAGPGLVGEIVRGLKASATRSGVSEPPFG